MVQFNSDLPGTAPHVWAADPRLHDRPAIELDDVTELLVVAAHPDDESLGAAGLIQQCSQLGVPVTVICVTNGDHSHPGRNGLAARRAAEFAKAVRRLAPEAHTEMLGFEDGATPEHRVKITNELRARIAALSPYAAVAVTWRGDGHRDHRVVGEVVPELVGERLLLEYPVWMWHWATPGSQEVPWESLRALAVDVGAKADALAAYTSQTEGPHPVLRADFLQHFTRGEELFVTHDYALRQEYFDALYAKSRDPWRLETRWYEHRKRLITLASLPKDTYERVLEIGCSIGAVTALLADRSTDLLSVDISAEAISRAQATVGPGVTFRHQDVMQEFPVGEFDLIVLSEVGYYWGGQQGCAAYCKISLVRSHRRESCSHVIGGTPWPITR